MGGIEPGHRILRSSSPLSSYESHRSCDTHTMNVARVQRERARGLQECTGGTDAHTDEGEGGTAQTEGSGCDTTRMGEEEHASVS